LGAAEREGHSGRSLEADLEKRLAELTEAAIISRSLARQYLRTARRFIAAARQASQRPDCAYYEAHLREARKAHRQARKCLNFARLCQHRVQCLADIAGYRTKSKRKTPLSPGAKLTSARTNPQGSPY
jgi:hypothetical protein